MKTVPFSHLIYMLLPISVVAYFYYKWIGNAKEIAVATARMTLQLLLIGYFLVYIFNNKNPSWGILIILFMIIAASFIALRNVQKRDKKHYFKIFFAILIGGSLNLILVLYFVIGIKQLYEPRFIIPLAGMVYANAMNAISLASERFEREIKVNGYSSARAIALKSALIPQINSFLAVGLVSLPGLMTGQILSGIDPIVAVRYQIVIMAMVLGSAGISVIIYLSLNRDYA